MKYEADRLVVAKSTPVFYAFERDGYKSNTVRVVDTAEKALLEACRRIEIVNTESGESFTRDITTIVDATWPLSKAPGLTIDPGTHIVCISWAGEKA